MYKQVLLGNKEVNCGKVYTSFRGVKEDYIVRFPNDNDSINLMGVFGMKHTGKICDVIKDTYLSLEGKDYKPSVDCITLNNDTFIFVVKDKEHNVFVSVLKDDVVYTVFIGHRYGNKMSFMRRFMDFFIKLPTFEN